LWGTEGLAKAQRKDLKGKCKSHTADSEVITHKGGTNGKSDWEVRGRARKKKLEPNGRGEGERSYITN